GVPWLGGVRNGQSGPDRLCVFSTPALTFRCWEPPAPGDREGQPLPESVQWLNPTHATWEDIARPDRVAATFVGGTFACLRGAPGDLWCLGDDRFGQLGAANAPRGASPAFLKVWPAESVGLGTWHGCALAARGDLSVGAFVACWGRGDVGQLGAPAQDLCRVDGRK